VEEHHRRTGSVRAAAMLGDWEVALAGFRQVVPVARVQAAAAPEPVADPSPENAPKTAA